MTENEAKQRWCPMTRFHVGGGGLTYDNKPQSDNKAASPKSPLCIASECMMWRNETSTNCHTGVNRVCGGYCGLAGKPL